MHFKIKICLFLILSLKISFSQNINFEKVLEKINTPKNALVELQKIDTSKISTLDRASWHYHYSYYLLKEDKQSIAFKNLITAKKTFISLGKRDNIANCNILLLETLKHQNSLNTIKKDLIKELESYAKSQKNLKAERIVYRNIAGIFLDLNNGKEAINYYRKIIPIALQLKDTIRVAYSYTNIGTAFQITDLYNLDSALYYSKKAVPILEKYDQSQNLAYNYNNQAQQYKLLKNYKKAIQLYKKADSIQLKENIKSSKALFYENLAETYELAKDYKNANLYLQKANALKDSINETQQNISISEIKEKYDNEKLRSDNLESEAKRKKNKNLLMLTSALLFFGIITFVLVQKNNRKKQRIAEQEKELEQQKLATVLKEQELTTIDAMVEGQEKERQRIANDLHDDLGSLLANVKLHFDALKNKKSEDLFDRTDALIDETYQKVRSLSHAKNSGVIAKEGLLKSVQNMADKISKSNEIFIQVFDHDLNDRLENSLELTLFRILQELVTNTLKHAEATEIAIHLTNHGNSLNILFEDNGKGFDPEKIRSKKEGMGIHSIYKRIEHLNGTLNIDSKPNKGTTFILDIPL